MKKLIVLPYCGHGDFLEKAIEICNKKAGENCEICLCGDFAGIVHPSTWDTIEKERDKRWILMAFSECALLIESGAMMAPLTSANPSYMAFDQEIVNQFCQSGTEADIFDLNSPTLNKELRVATRKQKKGKYFFILREGERDYGLLVARAVILRIKVQPLEYFGV